MTSTVARGSSVALPATLAGVALIVGALWASLGPHLWVVSAILGAAGPAAWRYAVKVDPLAPTQVALDAAGFAIFAIMRNDAAGFWQLAGPWSDVPDFN